MPSLATAPPAAVARTGAECPVKTGPFTVDYLVSYPSSLQSPATFSSAGTTSTYAPDHDPATALVDMVLSATSQPSTNHVSSPTSTVNSTVTVAPVGFSKPHPAPVLHLVKQDAIDVQVSDDPVKEPIESSSSVSQNLSPYAKVWVPTSNTIVKNLDVLYPAGKNSEGIEFEVSDEAWVALELGGKSSEDFELPGEATPDLNKTTQLFDHKVALPNGSHFVDKVLPQSAFTTQEDNIFPAKYFIDLHNKVRSSGTYNYAGARIELSHTKLNVDRFRYYLGSYDDVVICQFLQFGFPIGLAEEIFLEPALKNHQSSHLYFSYIDKFLHKEVSQYGIAGPLLEPPFSPTMLSPMMTSPKNPSFRRPVFDASWGD